MILLATSSLAKKLKIGQLRSGDRKVSVSQEWYGHLFTVKRFQLILFTNAYSLYSVVFRAKGINDLKSFSTFAAEELNEVLHLQGIGRIADRFIDNSFYNIEPFKTTDRAVLGSMNDMIFTTKLFCSENDISLTEMSARLNETPFSLIKYNHPSTIIKNMLLS